MPFCWLGPRKLMPNALWNWCLNHWCLQNWLHPHLFVAMTSLKLPISHQFSKMLINIYLHWTFNYIGIFWLLLVNSCSNLQNHTWVPVTWTSVWVSLAVGHIALCCPEPTGGNCCTRVLWNYPDLTLLWVVGHCLMFIIFS